MTELIRALGRGGKEFNDAKVMPKMFWSKTLA